MTDLFEHAEKLRDKGMQVAADHADSVQPKWTERAYDFLVEFARSNKEFISEDVSDASKEVGFPQPPSDRAWGSVYRMACRRGVITQSGIGRSRRRHASICPLWRSLCFT
jgi:hypothetical protein